MPNKIYTKAKNAFIDSIDPKQFIDLDSNILILEEINDLVDKNFKLALFYGPPGAGKSMILKKFKLTHKDNRNILLYDRPFFSKDELLASLSYYIFQSNKGFFHKVKNLSNGEYFIIFDEAQLYTDEINEFIRMIADTNKVKFLLSLHRNKKEKLLALEHFQTRIYKTIEIFPVSKNELKIYIQKRLFNNQLADLSKEFEKKEYINYIYKFTKGNLRETNKMLYALFDIMDYFNTKKPSFVNKRKAIKDFLQMSAIELGYINA